jgi:hypothetical protein
METLLNSWKEAALTHMSGLIGDMLGLRKMGEMTAR